MGPSLALVKRRSVPHGMSQYLLLPDPSPLKLSDFCVQRVCQHKSDRPFCRSANLRESSRRTTSDVNPSNFKEPLPKGRPETANHPSSPFWWCCTTRGLANSGTFGDARPARHAASLVERGNLCNTIDYCCLKSTNEGNPMGQTGKKATGCQYLQSRGK